MRQLFFPNLTQHNITLPNVTMEFHWTRQLLNQLVLHQALAEIYWITISVNIRGGTIIIRTLFQQIIKNLLYYCILPS